MKRLFFSTVVVCFSILFLLGGCHRSAPRSYGVFIGMEPSELKGLSHSYQTIVVDATKLSKEDVKTIKKQAKQVYAYLNVGALEKSNAFYQQFKHLAIEPYDGWPDEYWLDITDETWQVFLEDQLAVTLLAKGVDGLFLDNIDVYDHDNRPAVYQALQSILLRLKEKGIPLIVNGGDTFIRQLAEEEELTTYVDGINQEEVFYQYDMAQEQPQSKPKEAVLFYTDYLKQMQEEGVGLYVIEYGLNSQQRAHIQEQLQELDVQLYMAPSILLDKE